MLPVFITAVAGLGCGCGGGRGGEAFLRWLASRSVGFAIVRDALKIFLGILFLVLDSREIREGCFGEVRVALLVVLPTYYSPAGVSELVSSYTEFLLLFLDSGDIGDDLCSMMTYRFGVGSWLIWCGCSCLISRQV